MISESKKLAEFRNAALTDSPARKRLSYLFDDGVFTEIDAFAKAGDNFTGVIAAYGFVEGNPVYAFSQDKNVKSGAVGKAHATKICKVLELAAKTGAPVVGIHDSNGAFIDGGTDALAAYGDMLMWTSNISGVVPQISVIAGTCAGTAAVIACSSDIVIMTKDSEFFMAPPFDSKETSGAGTAANAAKSGTASLICDDDKAAVEQARKLISMLPANNLSPVPMFEFSENAFAGISDAASAVSSIADAGSVVELSAEFGKASYTAFATVGGATVGFVATNKTSDKLSADDCSKIARFVRTCDAFAVPVITIVDTEGFEPSAEAELAGSIRDAAKLANSYAEATTVKIAVVSGKAYGPAFTVLAGRNANADMVFAYPEAVITPLAPETAVEFLWHDKLKGAENTAEKRKELVVEYCSTVASAFDAAEKGCVNSIIEPSETRASLISALEVLAGKRVSRLPKKHNNMPF
jgi:acetyl-CoA carboxylase carboxyltransferase component